MRLRLWAPLLPKALTRRTRIVPGPLSTPCWEWTGATNAPDRKGAWVGGYGYIWHEGRAVRVHRLAFTLLVGEPGPLLHHECRNRRCWRPNHLERATSSENNYARFD